MGLEGYLHDAAGATYKKRYVVSVEIEALIPHCFGRSSYH